MERKNDLELMVLIGSKRFVTDFELLTSLKNENVRLYSEKSLSMIEFRKLNSSSK
ncbi:hypothetical protein OL234_06235 [Vagococcus intermedius]|uniref:Uncharacterized protein n=1 Tax=Vagococcus intermedius TaxID=2991418 RepID=A0AAF0I661_9ENTE|nr:hypothetical protein [Vagococcus intermedius]WEG72584.1 hypothetical protein OL234_06235 [Vagococcus intermedius]